MVGGLEQSRECVIGALEATINALRSPSVPMTDELRAVVAARNALDAALASGIQTLGATREFEAEGASSVNGWARRELRLDAAQTSQLVRAAQTSFTLSRVGESCRAGDLSAQHLRWFSYALRFVGPAETVAAEESLLEFGVRNEPAELGSLVKQLRDAIHPEDLDARWVAGMDRADIHLSRLMEGWHLTGFLPQEVGARLDALLRSWAVPAIARDERTSAERRLAGLDDLLERALADALPSDGTVPPQIHVTVDAGTLRTALAPGELEPLFQPQKPATLSGFGSIGPQLLSYLTCGARIEPVLVDRIGRNPDVLDVGNGQRLATAKQRTAIWLSQVGRCLAPGCRNSVSHVHHVRWFSPGGPTNLDNLVGLCGPCHRSVHAGALIIVPSTKRSATGKRWEFSRSRGTPIAA